MMRRSSSRLLMTPVPPKHTNKHTMRARVPGTISKDIWKRVRQMSADNDEWFKHCGFHGFHVPIDRMVALSRVFVVVVRAHGFATQSGRKKIRRKKKEKHVEKAVVEIVYDRSQRNGGWAQVQPHRTPEHVHCACVSATNTRRMRLNAWFDPLSLFSVFLCVPKKVLEDGLYLQKGVEVCVCMFAGVIYTPDTNQGGEIT